MSYEKLVRDGVPDSIVASGETPYTRELRDDREFGSALAQKLVEEASEAAAARNREEVVKELADLLEVMNAYADHHNVPWLQIVWQQERRRREVGGFRNRTFLLSVESKGGLVAQI